MLEPLFHCNLRCKGCGKISHPDEILKKRMSPKECMAAVEECGAPVVSIAGGEPLLHPPDYRDCRGLSGPEKIRVPVYQCPSGPEANP